MDVKNGFIRADDCKCLAFFSTMLVACLTRRKKNGKEWEASISLQGKCILQDYFQPHDSRWVISLLEMKEEVNQSMEKNSMMKISRSNILHQD
ncbi:hypothetical protein R6Q59_025904 [Mikania micrantha]